MRGEKKKERKEKKMRKRDERKMRERERHERRRNYLKTYHIPVVIYVPIHKQLHVTMSK